MKYRHKPTEVDAIQWDGDTSSFYKLAKGAKSGVVQSVCGRYMFVFNPAGLLGRVDVCHRGSWLVLEGGHLRVIDDHNFQALWEPVEP